MTQQKEKKKNSLMILFDPSGVWQQQHNLNALLEVPTPSHGSHNALRAPASLKTLSDHSSEGMTSRSQEDTAVGRRLMLLSAVARGRARQ